LEDAIAGAQYIQECVPENLAIKRELFAQLDQLADPQVILASSTSSMDIEAIASGLTNSHRCITAHPFNPAAILPVVEILATRQADAEFVDRAEHFLATLGQRPIRMHKFVKGYIGNRLQLALMREAFDLVARDIASTEAVDTVLSEGLALRWALLGTFGTNHTNADLGIRSYYRAYADTIKGLMDDLTANSPDFDDEMVERFGRELDQRFKDLEVSELSDWRDDVVSQIQALKRLRPLRV
jgi:3-hydroxyacyl-CoA dehydrogenase